MFLKRIKANAIKNEAKLLFIQVLMNHKRLKLPRVGFGTKMATISQQKLNI